jgi:5'-nucleotidase
MSTLEGRLVVAIATRALFDFEAENRVFETEDAQAYRRLQLERLEEAAAPGVAFPLVQKLLAFNAEEARRVEVVLLSRNDPVSGLRAFKSAAHHGLLIERGVFTQGRPPYQYLAALGAHLFLSMNEADVREALAAGFPAARVFPPPTKPSMADPGELRIAFDGDAVLFSDVAERVYAEQGLGGFTRHEMAAATEPLPPGPFKPLLEALQRLQAAAGHSVALKLRTALVTARSAPAHERAIRTLMAWGLEVDEAMFLGGLEKGPFLRGFAPDIFFDDQTRHCESAQPFTAAGHVAAGIRNPPVVKAPPR